MFEMWYLKTIFKYLIWVTF